MSDSRYDEVIKSILHFLYTTQSKTGGWNSLSGDKKLSTVQESKTTFHTSLILSCLSEVESSLTKSISKKAISFLLREKKSNSTWSYWETTIPKSVPPDFDDTTCALSAITLHSPTHVDGTILAHFAQHLTEAETKPGGPYSTWIVPSDLKKKWKDIDIVVNANIGFFLKLQDVVLPELTKIADQFILKPVSTSRYYFSPIIILYFISRFYAGIHADKAIQRILKIRKKGAWANPLETALAVSALLRFEYVGVKNLKTPLNLISKQTSWKPYPLYIEEYIGTPTYSGSSSLTAAFCLEAIELYRKAERRIAKLKGEKELHKLRDLVIERTLLYFGKKKSGMRRDAEKILRKMTETDVGNQITLLPYQFALSLKKKNSYSHSRSIELGVANSLGWLAYRVYDHILDNEGGVEHLSLANISIREVCRIYQGTIPEEIFKKIMDDMDAANDWERRSCLKDVPSGKISLLTLPLYREALLAEKSFGHALGPLALLYTNGYTKNSPEMRSLISFFTHYLIARQLNDDAHDWYTDLTRGFINPVSAKLLHLWKYKHGAEEVDIKNSKEELDSLFWHEHILPVAENILKHTRKAQALIQKNKALQDTTYLESLLIPIQNSAQKAIFERERVLDFLKEY